jgi:hypothetical protein
MTAVGGFIREVIRGIDRQQGHALRLQEIMPGELHGEITRKSGRVLDQDHLRPIAEHRGEHGAKALPLVDRVRAGHDRVVILLDDVIALRLGIRLHGCSLALLAVLVGSDIPRTRRAVVRNGRYAVFGGACPLLLLPFPLGTP